ncbi:DUF4012 domain-containing protein [Microbacterium sp. RD1]|uniref:DUF4012 domain-containing protein n=1 Tax=Microbacterium sp. RD1 TaxID=3457313 RepID=UPI003FA54014
MLAAVSAAAVWLGSQAWQVKDELTALAPLAEQLSSAVSGEDVAGAQEALTRFVASADHAAELSSTPLWRAAEIVPGVGANLAAARTVSAQLAVVGTSALQPLIALATSIGDSPDPLAIQAAREPLERADDAVGSALAAMDGIDVAPLLPPLREGVQQLRSALSTAAPVVKDLSDASAVAPGLLGQNGPREILVMLQNNAELRTGGGITGSYVQLHAEGGRISMVRQADSSSFPERDAPIVPIPDSLTALYGDAPGRFVQNSTMSDDFELSARLASAWWESAFGVAPDAVVAIDPVVLRALLAAHGPVDLPDGTQLVADDVLQRLLIDPYLNLTSDDQTTYQREVTSTLFTALIAGIDPVTWARALAPVIAEGRISVWSAVPAEQEVLHTSAVGGPRVRLDAAGDEAYGVYLNDGTGGKMDSVLDVSVASGTTTCVEGGASELVVRVALTNGAPQGEDPAGWPISMTGGGLWGTAPGDIATHVAIVGPRGSAFAGASNDTGPLPSANAEDEGRPTAAVRVVVAPGQTGSVEMRFVLAGADTGSETLLHTPTLTPVAVTSLQGSACRD